MRGDVLQAKRRIGFAGSGTLESFVVLQSDAFHDYERIAIAPIDDSKYHPGNPLAVGISPRQVVLLGHLAVVSRETFKAEPIGHVDNLEQVDRVLAIFLGI
jgi:hypothetical protein